MAKRLVCLTLLLVLALALSSIPAAAQKGPDPLLAMLALVPDTADARAGNSIVSYVDFRAVEAAAGITKPANSPAFAALGDAAARSWVRAVARVRSGPQSMLLYFKIMQANMPKLVGFDWFDIDRALEYGTPPRLGTILGGTFDSVSIGKALSARDFKQMDVDGVPVWNRLEDGQFDLKSREPGDPFGGEFGAAARIAIMPGYIANSRFWDLTKQMVSAYKQTQKSLADAPDYRSLADAITDAKTTSGPLVQAQFIPASALAEVTPPTNMWNPPDLKQYGELPAYALAVLADRQEGDSQVHLVALAYPDADTAKQASIELHKRIAGFDINKMFETSKVTVDEPSVYQSKGGLFVAVVSVRYPLPVVTDSSSGTPPPQAGLVFRMWIDSIYRRQFYPLAVKLPKQPAS